MSSASKLGLTGHETGPDLLKILVRLRGLARHTVQKRRNFRAQIKAHETALAAGQGGPNVMDEAGIAKVREMELTTLFDEVQIGQFLHPLCAALDQRVSRDEVFEALCVGQAERTSEGTKLYANKSLHIITALDLENSATASEDIEIRPLKWCHTMAFIREMQTNTALDRAVHEGTNELFGGVFGEFRERPLIERLTGGKT